MTLRFSDEELQAMIEERDMTPPPLWSEPVGFLGRLAASFADSPEGKQNILNNLGIEGDLRDPVGFDVGDIADFAGTAPAMIGGGIGTVVGNTLRVPGRGAALGAGYGQQVSELIGQALGSKEEPRPDKVAVEAVSAGSGERILGPIGRILSPFPESAATANIRKNVIEPAERFGVDDLPADALTESNLVGKAAGRARAKSTPHGDQLRAAQQGLMDRQRGAYDRIAERAGSPVDFPSMGDDALLKQFQDTRESRMDLVGSMFDEARDVVGSTDFPVVIDETRDALRRMSSRGNISTLRGSNITSGAEREWTRLLEDVDNIQTFRQMDAFRQEVGNLLNNPQRMEELRKAGGDLDYRDIYGALKRDLETSLGEGKLAQEFGGQTRGQLGSTRKNPLGVQTSTPNQGHANVSRMQEGVYGERDLPGFPGRESEVARGRIPGRAPTDADARSSTEMLDELSGRVERAQGMRDEASELFADLIDTERSQIINMVKDPARAENVNSLLFRPGGTVENIRSFKQHLGAEPTAGGNPATNEGIEAWRSIQSRLFRDIRDAAEDASANRLPDQTAPLAGEAMERALDKFGGQRGVLDEAIGPEAAKELYDFARFLRESDPRSRTFSNISQAEAEAITSPSFLDKLPLIRAGLERIADAALRNTSFPGPGKASTLLTTGYPQASGILRAIGTVAGARVPAEAYSLGTSR